LPAQPSPRFAETWASVSLDGMRGAAALLVLLFHWRNSFFVSYHEVGAHRWLFFTPYVLTAAGHEAVIIFFVLSGFLIGGTVTRSMTHGLWSWPSYLTHRLVRLWIVLVPGLLLCLFWDVVRYWRIDSAMPKALGELNTDTVADFFGTLFFLQGVLVRPFGSDAPLWSLANEFWYYILFPLGMLSILPSTRFRTRALTAGLFLLLCLWLARSILPLFPIWLMGAAVLVLPRLRLGNPVRWLAMACYVRIIFLCSYLETRLHAGSDFILGGATAALVWILLSDTQIAPSSEPAPRLCRALARFSYTLYVVHAPLLVLLASLMVGTTRWQPTGPHIAQGLGILALIIGSAFVVAALSEFHTGPVRAWVERQLGLEVRNSGTPADPRPHL
jgi:peptidoglycan/LPS O-acetylase OafA/YrhL